MRAVKGPSWRSAGAGGGSTTGSGGLPEAQTLDTDVRGSGVGPGPGADASTGDPVDTALLGGTTVPCGRSWERQGDRAEKAECGRPGSEPRAEGSGVSPTSVRWALEAPHGVC